MAKVFNFRGKTLEELLGMTLEEFALHCNSRAKRSLKRGFDKKLLNRIKEAWGQKKNGKEPRPIRTHLRDAIVVPSMVGLRFDVYKGGGASKGEAFLPVEVKAEMLGHYLGEMALTRKRLVHGKAGIGATKSSSAISARG